MDGKSLCAYSPKPLNVGGKKLILLRPLKRPNVKKITNTKNNNDLFKKCKKVHDWRETSETMVAISGLYELLRAVRNPFTIYSTSQASNNITK